MPRNLAKELLRGLKEIRAWKRGKLKLKTTKVKARSAKKISRAR